MRNLSKPKSTQSSNFSAKESDVEVDVLKGMLAASNDACWCMEFREPVDLTAPDAEVVRQVFENDPVWRHCNQAMARLYHLPAGEDFNTRPVGDIFPRNRQNEEFVHKLIANGFEVDAAPALDKRYDDVKIHVENDVRAHIVDGFLVRMFGVVRDIGKHKQRERVLKDRLEAIDGILSAIPDPLIAVDAGGLIEAINPAGATWLGQPAETVLGQTLKAVLAGSQHSVLPPELTQIMTRVKTLGTAVALRLSGQEPTARWYVGPRETSSGTAFVIQITPDVGVGG